MQFMRFTKAVQIKTQKLQYKLYKKREMLHYFISIQLYVSNENGGTQYEIC